MIRRIRKVSKTHFFLLFFLSKIFFIFLRTNFLKFFWNAPLLQGSIPFFFFFFFSKNHFFFPKQILMLFLPFFPFYKKIEIPYHSFFIPFSFQKECLKCTFHSFLFFYKDFSSFFILFLVFLWLLIIPFF